MPRTTVPVPIPPGKCHRRRLPNELLSELVDWLPMAQFVADTTMAPSPPRFGASQMREVQERGRMRNVALTVYLDRARHKYEKVQDFFALRIECDGIDPINLVEHTKLKVNDLMTRLEPQVGIRAGEQTLCMYDTGNTGGEPIFLDRSKPLDSVVYKPYPEVTTLHLAKSRKRAKPDTRKRMLSESES